MGELLIPFNLSLLARSTHLLMKLIPLSLRLQYYHTSKDLVKNIQVGSTQHFGANVLSLVDSLTSSGSRLPYIEKKGSKKQSLGSSFLPSFLTFPPLSPPP